ncbi:hypothetical protein OAF54_01180 [bacterium]|nr:hypothetical protein [bacterium]
MRFIYMTTTKLRGTGETRVYSKNKVYAVGTDIDPATAREFVDNGFAKEHPASGQKGPSLNRAITRTEHNRTETRGGWG